MRGATECAKRLKLLFSSLRSKLGKVGQLAVGDPITQMLLGVLSRNVPESKAREALDRLRAIVVDYNELRVVPPIELTEIVGDFPDARLKCEDISRSLNAVFAREHIVSLDHLAEMSKKETLTYLQGVGGLDDYTVARIRLLGLQQHAIPLDEAMWALARQEEIVHPRCPLHEAQQFLERQITEEHALEFVALLKRHAWNELGAAVRNGEVERILSVPPDRSTRNMLQMVAVEAAGGAVSAAGSEATEIPAAQTPPETRRAARSRAAGKSAGEAGGGAAGTARKSKQTGKQKAKRRREGTKSTARSRSGARGSTAAKRTVKKKTRKPTARTRRKSKASTRARTRKTGARAKSA